MLIDFPTVSAQFSGLNSPYGTLETSEAESRLRLGRVHEKVGTDSGECVGSSVCSSFNATFEQKPPLVRWCPSSPDFFATSSASGMGKGAAIQIHNVNHLSASATVITVAPRPHRVIDFDWLATRGTPRIAAAVGHDVLIFPISVD